MSDSPDITHLLADWRQGKPQAGDDLMRVVYEQLHTIAARHLRAEGGEVTLYPSDLVNEAYIRLAGADVEWQNRVHFFAFASRVMRNILVDHARAQMAERRGARAQKVPLEDFYGAILLNDAALLRVLALDHALTRLAAQDPRKSQIVEMTFFGGMTREEAAAAVDISPSTLQRELRLAKAWLHIRLSGAIADDNGPVPPVGWAA